MKLYQIIFAVGLGSGVLTMLLADFHRSCKRHGSARLINWTGSIVKLVQVATLTFVVVALLLVLSDIYRGAQQQFAW